MRAALVAASLAAAACGHVDPGWEKRMNAAASPDEPSTGHAVLAGGAVEYDVTIWHLGTGMHVDTTVHNRGPGVLRLDPARLRIVAGTGEDVAPTPSGCSACRDGVPCAQVASAAAVREIAPGASARVVRCFAALNPFAGRHAVSGADPKKLLLTLREEGLERDGAPLVAVVEIARR